MGPSSAPAVVPIPHPVFKNSGKVDVLFGLSVSSAAS